MAKLRTDSERALLFREGTAFVRSLRDRIFTASATIFFCTIFLIIIGTGFTQSTSQTNASAQTNRVALVQYINRTNPAFRAREAKELLELDSGGAISVADNASWNDASKKEVTDALTRVAKTGEAMKLSAPSSVWHEWRVGVSSVVIVAFLLWGTICFLMYLFSACYSSEGSEKSRFLVDMPYRKVWPVVFVLTWVVGWPFFIASAVRYRKAKRQAVAQKV